MSHEKGGGGGRRGLNETKGQFDAQAEASVSDGPAGGAEGGEGHKKA